LAFAALLAIFLAGCSNQKDSAQNLIWEIEATVSAAEPEAAKFVPEQLTDIRSKLGDLRASFDKKDYAGVISAAPAVLGAAQSLATAAAAKKDEILKVLNDDWSNLASAVPGEVTALQSRVEQLQKKSGKKLANGVDIEVAKDRMGDVTSLWSKAQAAFAAGNLNEAVATAKDVKSKADALAAALKMDLAQPAGSG
jgi:PBP1b-binding outer membrane lipoprotein LpoB